MVIHADQSKAWVEVAGSAAKEYEVESGTIGEKITMACFIEAEEDKTFTVCYKNSPSIKGCQTRLILSIDGKPVSTQVQCGKLQDSNFIASLKGYKAMTTGMHETLRAFTFGKMTTTSNASEDVMTAKIADDMCTIRLDVQLLSLIGGTNHRPLDASVIAPPADTRVHEDSKAAMMGISAKAGALIHVPATKRCLCAVDPTPQRHFSITFRYVPRSYLIARGHNMAFATTETGGSARNGLQDTTSRPGRVRSAFDQRDDEVKPQTKVKPKVKPEQSSSSAINDRKRPRVTMDLTAEGEGYRMVRAIRETIVISDDESEEDI